MSTYMGSVYREEARRAWSEAHRFDASKDRDAAVVRWGRGKDPEKAWEALCWAFRVLEGAEPGSKAEAEFVVSFVDAATRPEA